MLGRHYLGFEIVKEYCEFAKNRISKVQEDLFKWVDGEVGRDK
jgi:DNA modification methylase